MTTIHFTIVAIGILCVLVLICFGIATWLKRRNERSDDGDGQ